MIFFCHCRICIIIAYYTSEGKQSAKDGYIIRRLAIELGIPYVTTLAGARAALNAIEAVKENELKVKSLNDHIANI